jgi:ESCRT-II complex subunit VPS22
MRRGIGVAAVKKRQNEQQQFANLVKEVESVKLGMVRNVLGEFRSQLQQFAAKHRHRINSDPEFRKRFHQMCMTTGVDPLASNKGIFADILGIGQFYFELGVGVVEICLKTRSRNGGIISVADVIQNLQSSSSNSIRQHVSAGDVIRAVEKLSVLGNGYRVLNHMGKAMILSVPMELNRDHEDIIVAAQDSGYVTYAVMLDSHKWTPERFHRAVYPLLQDGVVWLDDCRGVKQYYFPSLMTR